MKKSFALPAAILAAASFSFAPFLSGETPYDQARNVQQQLQGSPPRQDARPAPAAAQQANPQDAKMEQDDYVKGSASDNEFEIQAGKFVQQHSQNPQVKRFAQKLAQDHQLAQERLKQVAQGLDITISDQLLPVQQAMLDELQKKQGADLERAFVFGAIGDHHKDILCNEYEARHAPSQQVKQFARQQIPILRQHLQMAMQTSELWVPPQAREAGEHIRGRHIDAQGGPTTPPAGASNDQGGANR